MKHIRRSSFDPGRSLTWIITALIWAALFTPLIITPGSLFPFQTGKGFAFRVLVEMAGFFYLWLCIIQPNARPKPNSLFWSVLIFAAVLISTTLTSVNMYRSFWGDIERMEGSFGILHGVLLFVITSGLFSKKQDWTRFFWISLAASFFVTLYALAQLYPAFRFFPVFEIKDVQPGSTLGYHSFVATYAIFQMFFAGFLVILERTTSRRILAGAFLLMNAVLLALTAIRGAQVAMIAAVLIGALLLVIHGVNTARNRIAIIAVLVACIGFFLGIIALKDSPLLEKMPHAIQRMSTISLNTPTAKTRLISLQISWEAFKEKPLLGWGQDNFSVAYNRHFDPEHLAYEQAWFDRAHNKVAEVAVQTGIIGLLSYLAIFGFAFFGLTRRLRSPLEISARILIIGVIMLGAAYFVQNLFLFDMPASYLLFFSSLAFAVFLTRSAENDPRKNPGRIHAFIAGNRRPVLVTAAVAAGFLVVQCNWVPYTTATLGRSIQDLSDKKEVLALYDQAVQSGGFPLTEVVRATLDGLIATGKARTPEWETLTSRVRKTIEGMIPEGQADARMLVRLGKLYNEQYRRDGPRAEQVLRRAIADAPLRPEAYYELGVTYLLNGDVERGIAGFYKALEFNQKNSRAHWVLGLALASQRRFEEGLSELEQAKGLGHNWNNESDIQNLTIVYEAAQEHDLLAKLYEDLVNQHPVNLRYRIALAKAYMGCGKSDKAKEQVRKVVELDPHYEQEAVKFIHNLGL